MQAAGFLAFDIGNFHKAQTMLSERIFLVFRLQCCNQLAHCLKNFSIHLNFGRFARRNLFDPLPIDNTVLNPVKPIDVAAAQRLLDAGGLLPDDGARHRSSDGGQNYQTCSGAEFVDKVSLPDTWLFCSGEHDIETVSEDETRGN